MHPDFGILMKILVPIYEAEEDREVSLSHSLSLSPFLSLSPHVYLSALLM